MSPLGGERVGGPLHRPIAFGTVRRASCRKQLIIARLYTEIWVVMPVTHALGDGWDVTEITDACGGVRPAAGDNVAGACI